MSKRLTIEYVYEIAKSRGGKCLSTIYQNNRTKMLWECKQGHKWETRLDNVVSNNNWCPDCSGNRKKDLNYCKQFAINKNGKCLSKNYINNSHKMKWECRYGHIWSALPQNVFSGKWCPECGYKVTAKSRRKTLRDAQELATKKGGKCLSTKYESANSKLKWKCSNGHIWNATYGNVKYDTWCPYCSIFKSENLCRIVFEAILREKFPKSKPRWLRNPKTGFLLELDGYCEKLGIAFEHQGEHHYTQGRRFSKTKKELDKIKYRDKIKRKLCKSNFIILIEIPALGTRTKIENLKSFILKELLKHGIVP